MSKETELDAAKGEGAASATAQLKEMFVDIVQEGRIKLGQKPALRAVFRKLHGVAHGRLEMAPNIPQEFKVGIFTHDKLDAWVRFSSDTAPNATDFETTLGIGIKLFGVPGPNALGEEGNTADFIMQNFPIFFVDTAEEMAAFTHAGVVLNDYDSYLKEHKKTADILNRMKKVESSVLTTGYWAILPFHCGSHYVKYRLVPETAPENVPNDSSNYLAVDMARRLAKSEYRFRLEVQKRTNPESMPLDRATVEWPLEESAFVHVATLILPPQDIGRRGQAEYGELLSFNIWRVPPAQAPFGSIADARKVAYAAGAQCRRMANGEPLQEAPQPRPSATPLPVVDDAIVKAAIYPSIGVARVGSSPDAWFVGPEVPEPPAEAEGFYRDAQKRLKRQAARFRVYGLNAKGEIVHELTPANAQIEWKVQLANTKAAWYGFQLALDIPEAKAAQPTTLRNASVSDRARLAITPKPQSVSGIKAPPRRFDDGKFWDKEVYLGEIFTDDQGRLLVLGGHGAAASYDNSRAITFANNEAWHDDVSDGPVKASVTYQNQELEVLPAWVVVAPPNYGPMRKSVRTMWDLMRDVSIKAGTLPMPERPSFSAEILPIFQRMAGLQWVNAGFASGFGWRGAFDLTSSQALERLSDASASNHALRQSIALQFRNYAVDGESPKPWPWIYGDSMSLPPVSMRQNATLSDTQLAMLKLWADGKFIEDWPPREAAPTRIEDVPPLRQGEVLTRAALEFCLADAFHPGCEMTWPVRAKSIYMQPFRFAHAPTGWIAPGLGDVLSSDGVTIPNGPLYGQQPGGITRWMAVPWQTDTASCQSGYDKSYDPYIPSFWPARVPNQVLSEENYKIVVDEKRPLSERLAAFANRASWLEPLGSGSYTEKINHMIHHFDHLGVVEVRNGPSDRSHFPAHLEVEDQHVEIPEVLRAQAEQRRLHASKATAVQGQTLHLEPEEDLASIEKVHRFPRGLD
ncbi:LodA/GoxA family CTQ-dependent oxidase [Massilia sp. BJB1822]|uniref:LodA/GoxA family CTQ-dependent oxidase n=1 Tax=Massilia sp. BJB1822 TaxID=2744470 RepID=UPI00159495E3|nr:LodA/GoxA family CTQ-dependent oxidase [Massilia sp. BJB1822]NVD97990.1 hypothetical protein [Massilia sp. BJB1822]